LRRTYTRCPFSGLVIIIIEDVAVTEKLVLLLSLASNLLHKSIITVANMDVRPSSKLV